MNHLKQLVAAHLTRQQQTVVITALLLLLLGLVVKTWRLSQAPAGDEPDVQLTQE